MQVPTILIGLGGTGSQIVDMIYDWIPENRRDLVAIHTFDTDVNDIAKLKNLKRENITQTSTNYTVGQYMALADTVVKDWFPHEIKELHRKTLTDGAGQIRAVSRLAYRAAMENNALNSLQTSIAKIERLRSDGHITNIRVMIVCTLAGGTGAGIFLQTAMYIRELLQVSFGRQNVLIRGVFILPDTLVLNNTLSQTEHDNVRSNAYASIKELNAIYRTISSNGLTTGNKNVQIQMEYRPNQTDDLGRLNLNLGFDNLPYDYCVLFDFENEDGKNIGSFKRYKEMVAKTTFFDLFTPMSNTLFSKQDNQIKSLLASGGLTRFCGSGLAAATYPYADIVSYHSLRWVSSFLSDQWLAIDVKVKQEYKDYENDIAKGINREPFNYGERFIKNIDEMKDQNPFFRKVYREVNIMDEKNNPVSFKSDEYFAAIDEQIKGIFSNDDKIQGFESECTLREDELKDNSTAPREVARVENNLREYKDAINKFVQENKTILADKVLTIDARKIVDFGKDGNFENYTCTQPFQLNFWLLSKETPISPISVRYILYQIINELDKRIKTLNSTTDSLKKSISDYEEKAYDLPETEDLVETAEERIRKALDQNVFSRLLKQNEFKLFIDEYIDKSSGQRRRLNELKMKNMQLEVYQSLKIYLTDLSSDFERYFDILSYVRNNISKELNLAGKMHDEADNPSIIYAYASQKNKERQWDEIRGNYIDEGVPANISKQIYLSIFHRLCKRVLNFYTSGLEEKSIENEFRSTVLDWCTMKMKSEERLDITVYEALRKEAEAKEIDEKELDNYVSEQLKKLIVLAKPFIQKPISISNIAEMAAWGLHPKVKKQFSEQLIGNTFTDGSIVDEEAFSKYEIIREKIIYGLRAEDLTKFKEPNGTYFRAYTRVISEMLKNPNIVTPHLDKRWHLPAHLPSLTDEGIKVEEEKINRAFVIGLAMKYLIQLDNYGKLSWYFKGDNTGMQIINVAADKPAGPNAYQLHEALLYNPAIIDKILEKFENDKDLQLSNVADYKSHLFYNGAINIQLLGKEINLLQLVLSYADGRSADKALVEKSKDLLKTSCIEIANYLKFSVGEHKAGEVETAIKELFGSLKRGSAHYSEADKNSSRFNEWETIINNALGL
jgi:hypothetical protein